MQVGIIGLPNVGKTTIFNSLTTAKAAVANYPFCTIEPNQGLVSVADNNLLPLSKIYNSAKVTPAAIKILDVAGLVEGASRGEGLGNKFLASIREVDVVAHVIRCFYDENVAHSNADIDPENDIDIINTELMLADIETLSKKKDKFASLSKSGDAIAKESLEFIEMCIAFLNAGDVNRCAEQLEKREDLLKQLNLLSIKPVIYIANINENKESQILFERLQKKAAGQKIVKVYGKIENELCDFPEEEKSIYRKELGIENDGLRDFIAQCYIMLGLITFYTINENETRAWPVKKGINILDAAGKIHTDMQKGFIKAEVISCADLIASGSYHAAREAGKLKIEGAQYIVKDMDVIQIRFNL
ncbi:MAG: redox-regulated ATPase YchF [Actinobacteria bacterium]|nr:redox-regulated ATPase YchF [Actinomycetota bacterium]